MDSVVKVGRGRGWSLGTKLSESHKKKIRDSHPHLSGKFASMYGRCGELHPRYVKDEMLDPIKNNKIIHNRIWKLYGKADCCENTKCLGKSERFEWSNKNHKYNSLKRSAWQKLCQSCHVQYDKLHNGKYKR